MTSAEHSSSSSASPRASRLLAVLEFLDADRAAVIGSLCASERGIVLAELLANVETDPDDLVRPS